MVKKILVFIIIGVISFYFFMPKKDIYYTMESYLSPYDIEINEGDIDSNLLYLKLKDVNLFVKGIDISKIKDITIYPFFFYNKIIFSNISISNNIKSEIPIDIKSGYINYTLIDPLNASFYISGDFGVAKGYFSIQENKVYADIIEVKNIDKIKRYLTKDNGGWHYEKSFK